MLFKLGLSGMDYAYLWGIAIEMRFNFFFGQIILKTDKTLSRFQLFLLLKLIYLLTLPNTSMIRDEWLTLSLSKIEVEVSFGLFLMREMNITECIGSGMQGITTWMYNDGFYMFRQYFLERCI